MPSVCEQSLLRDAEPRLPRRHVQRRDRDGEAEGHQQPAADQRQHGTQGGPAGISAQHTGGDTLM